MKETVHINILIRSKNDYRKVKQSITRMSKPALRKRKQDQFSQSR